MPRIETIAEGVTLYLGDCRDILPALEIDVVVTDPPYGTGCAPRGGKSAGSVDFDAIPQLSWDTFSAEWLDGITCPVAAFCHPATASILGAYMRSDGLLVYVKSNPSPFGTSIETCVTRGFGRRPPQHIEAYNAFNGQVHPTQKPLEVMEFICRRAPGGTICDPFMGSGTTGVAAIKIGRKFVGIEIDPNYFSIACRRISDARKQPDMFMERPQEQLEWAEMWSKPFDKPELIAGNGDPKNYKP